MCIRDRDDSDERAEEEVEAAERRRGPRRAERAAESERGAEGAHRAAASDIAAGARAPVPSYEKRGAA